MSPTAQTEAADQGSARDHDHTHNARTEKGPLAPQAFREMLTDVSLDQCRQIPGHVIEICQDAANRLYAAEVVAAELLALLIRYRNETPLGHQPHMIAGLADAAIAKAGGRS